MENMRKERPTKIEKLLQETCHYESGAFLTQVSLTSEPHYITRGLVVFNKSLLQKVRFLVIENNSLKHTLCLPTFLLDMVVVYLAYIYLEKNNKLKQRNYCQENCCRHLCQFVSICQVPL